MNRYRHQVLALAPLSLGLLVAAPVGAASLAQVSRGTWGASGVPDYVNMYIYVPDMPMTNPPVVVACHSCGTPVSGYFNSISGVVSAADSNGFILILPEATGRNCWDVGTPQSLTHDGGGDTQAVAQMVDYVLNQYGANADRVYIMGGSSGAMMTQAMLAVYPDVFKAGVARAGVPAGCWADGYDPSNQWSGNCAGGRTTKTAQQWGDLVRGMYPGYDGPRPRVLLFHGTADGTIDYKNQGEAIKEWTNVLGLSTTPTTTDTANTPISNYTIESWENDCDFTVLEAWAGQNGSHSMGYETDVILEFFGLDDVTGPDPGVAACSGSGGSGGAGGAGGQPGSGGSGNEGGVPSEGGSGTAIGGSGGGQGSCEPGVDTGDSCEPAVDTEVCVRTTRDCVCGSDSRWSCTVHGSGSGGTDSAGGAPNAGGTTNSGGSTSGLGGSNASGGAVALGGAMASLGGAPTTGGAQNVIGGSTGLGGSAAGGQPSSGGSAVNTGGAVTQTGGSATGGLGSPAAGSTSTPGTPDSDGSDDGGCSCRIGGRTDTRSTLGAALALLAGLVLRARRQRLS